MLGIPHPYLTASLPGIGGRIKETPEDFQVCEVPLYHPCGEGEHTYFEVEKADLSTFEAIDRLARALEVDAKDFGYAGLKDRKGLTRQTLSLGGVPPERVEAVQIPQIRILSASLHTNKLRVGHLRGNRFHVRLRDVAPDAAGGAERIIQRIEETGVPNYYGPQRFGNRGCAHLIGRAFVKGDAALAVRTILGHPTPDENNPHVVRARDAFDRGDLDEALAAFPSTYREERRLLSYLRKAGPESYAGAARRLQQVTRRLYVTAYQSYLFNLALTRRLEVTGGEPGRLLNGDVAYLHRNGALFLVRDAEAERARAEAFEISPSGPIFGMKMLRAEGTQGEIDGRLLEMEDLRLGDFHQLLPRLQLAGGRRPFRVRVGDLSWHMEDTDLVLEFFLPKGSYATTFLRELMKNDEVPEQFYHGGEEEKHGLWRPRS